MQGLGLDQQTCDVLKSFGLERQLDEFSQDLHVEVNRAVGQVGDEPKVLLRDDQYNHRRCGCSSITPYLSSRRGVCLHAPQRKKLLILVEGGGAGLWCSESKKSFITFAIAHSSCITRFILRPSLVGVPMGPHVECGAVS
jgi:hypothetical protein